MTRLLIIIFTLFSFSFAQTGASHKAKVLYLSFEKTPKRVIRGEVFAVTIKALSTISNYKDIKYKLLNYKGLRALNREPYRKKGGRYLHDTFYFIATSTRAKLPDFRASLKTDSAISYRTTTLIGNTLNVIALNPTKEFSNIVADSFKILDYKTTNYDNKHNIVVFSAIAKNSDISALKLQNVFKQGIESIKKSYFNPKITYYAVIDKKIENFSFSYFNPKLNKFIKINIPITVIDDSVTTQSDLKPKDQSKERLKMGIAAVVALIGFILILWQRKYIYLIIILLPLGYIAIKAVPAKEICVKKGSLIYLLPVKNGTIFEKTKAKLTFQKEGSVKDFTKIKLKNEKIGWIRNEDICKN